MIKIRDDSGQVVTVPTLKGSTGKSAYDYAVAGGYKGTEQDFIDFLNNTTTIMNEHKVDSDAHSDIRNEVSELKDMINSANVIGNIASGVNVHNADESAHLDIRQSLAGVYNEAISIKETWGNDITLTDSTDGNLADFRAFGKSTQRSWNGFDNELLPGDYSLTEAEYRPDKNGYVCSKNAFICAANEVIKIAVQNAMNIYCYFYNNGEFVSNSYKENVTEAEFTVPNGITEFTFCVGDGSTTTIDNIGEIALTINGAASFPSTESPQKITSIGDGGYFDGELLQGVYTATDGQYGTNNNYLCNKNMIPCKPNDNILLTYKTDEQKVLYILFYDKDKNYLSRINENTSNTLTTVAPNSAYYFNFDIYDVGTTPDNAKPITVTINSKYALIVKSTHIGRNIYDYTKGITGIPFYYEDGTTGTTGGTGDIYVSTVKAKGDQTYTIKKHITDTTYWMRVACLDQNMNFIERAVVSTAESATFTTPSNTRYLQLAIDEAIRNIVQLEEGSVATEFEPYKEVVNYISIDKPLRGIDGVRDEIDCINGVYGVVRRYTEVVFDGNSDENWNVMSTNTNTNLFRIYPPKKAKVSPIICSHFVYYSGSNEDFEHTRLSVEANPVLAMWVNKTRITTVDEWKTWLQANPITVQYELAEPVFEPFEDQSLFNNIATFTNVTNIVTVDNADMYVKYYRDNVYGSAMANMTDKVNAYTESIDGKAPLNHASTGKTYGTGNATNYGHVKLSDSYETSAGTASEGVAASSKALADAYAGINTNLLSLFALNDAYIRAVPNQAQTTKLIINGTNPEQIYLFIGAGVTGSLYILVMAPSQSGSLAYKSLGITDLTPTLKESKVIEIPVSNWSRGFIISNNNFSYRSE